MSFQANLHVMHVAPTPEQLAKALGNKPVFTCVYIPTMGALHEGHLALIRRGAEFASPVVVSIFVNPTQFGPDEDFEKYPRTLDADLEAARSAGAQIVFTPTVETIYPQGVNTPTPTLPEVAVAPGLEDAHRPGHFAGVCQVVARLFDLVQPGCAIFGEKDYQQLLVIQEMVKNEAQRWPGLNIVSHPTVRDPDGLAMSSRNRFLTPAQRKRALGLSAAIKAATTASTPDKAETTMRNVLSSHDVAPDYAVLRNSHTLMPITSIGEPARAMIAARVDEIRLIDNGPMPT